MLAACDSLCVSVYRNLKECLNGRASDQNSTIHLTSTELKEAENYWIHHVQAQSFTKEFQYLTKQSSAATPVYIKQLGLFLHNEFISVLAIAERNPTLLPSKHTSVNLLVADFHAKVKHNGVNDTLVALCEKYWVFQGR